jgi:hypothetical protein
MTIDPNTSGFTNEGLVRVNSTRTLVATDGYVQQTANGATDVYGTLQTTAGMIDIQGGNLSGTGTVMGTVNNSGGEVKPGSSPGGLTINGFYTQGSGGALTIDIASLTLFDVLSVSGQASLGGVLNIVLLNGFVPPDGSTFTILTGNPVSGTFATINDAPGDGVTWNATYDTNDVTLQATTVPTAVGGTMREYVLSVSAYPNPFNPTTTIRYTLPSKGRVVIAIYNAKGARVSTLLDEERPAGAYMVPWDGRSDGGELVSSGVYLARITFGSERRAYEIVLVK